MKINIADLDLSLQTRAGTDAETIDNYAEAMAEGAQFPDVTVFADGERYYLADGFHRVMAAKQNGYATISADVRKGTADDAVVFGGTANNKQGKRPTRADVRHFLEMVWERRGTIFGGTPTGGNLAAKCGVSERTGRLFVQEQLGKLPGRTPDLPTMPTRQIAGLSAANSGMAMPARPVQLVGANGKMYPARPPRRALRADSEVPCDRYGTEIPVEIQGAFDTVELTEIAQLIGKARGGLRHRLDPKAPHPAFAAVRQDALIMLDNAYNYVRAAMPHCVCRMCQGSGCRACHSRGWQTSEEYERNPREFKA